MWITCVPVYCITRTVSFTHLAKHFYKVDYILNVEAVFNKCVENSSIVWRLQNSPKSVQDWTGID